MNIKITHNWLLEYLETDASPDEIQKYLSLCGPSVETVTKEVDDHVYDIEITSNRIDMASVLGIAQEAQAILPQFNKKAKLKVNPLEKYKFNSLKKNGDSKNILNIKIVGKDLCSRFTAVVLDNVRIAASPDFIKQRLNLCGIKSINNVVDISNYLMIALGQPVHVFDYERIAKATMILRVSKKGEKIVTLDGKEITLPGGDIVIEDGSKRLVDLCGIMGGLNSAVTPKTSKIILFVQTYNPQKIRRTSMLTGQRTVAATYFEKGLDEERVEPTAVYGIMLLEKYAGAKVASQIYDIYPNPYKAKKVFLSPDEVQRIVGVSITKGQIIKILSNLGFTYHLEPPGTKMVLEVPSYRSRDVSIKEDLIEEIARIYGYHNLPNNIQPTVYVSQPKEIELLFELQSTIKHFLKNLGLHEVMNYSMTSKEDIENADLKVSDHLLIKNSISEDIQYMRRYLAPSLIKNIKNNEGKKENLKFFEIAKGYKPRPNDLPVEKYQLAIATNTSLDDLKGIIDILFRELHIVGYKITQSEYKIFARNMQGQINIGKDWLGKFGILNRSIKEKYELNSEVFLASFEFEMIMKYYNTFSSYRPVNPFAEIKLDLTVEQNPKRSYSYIKETAFKIGKLLQKVELVDVFKNKITLRFYFSGRDRNITEEEAKKELEKIKGSVLKLV